MADARATLPTPRLAPAATEAVVFTFPNEFDDQCSGSLVFELVAIGSGVWVEPRVTLKWWAGDFPRPGSMQRLLERACDILGRDVATVLVRSRPGDVAHELAS